MAFGNRTQVSVYKAPIPAARLIRERRYKEVLSDALRDAADGGFAAIGHSRLVTDGGREVHENNQPVIKDGVVGIHNGIVVNHHALWQAHPDLRRSHDVDSEVIFALLRKFLAAGDLGAALSQSFAAIEGAASIAALFEDSRQLVLGTNTGSLYYRSAPDASAFLFASEAHIVDAVAGTGPFRQSETTHLQAGTGLVVELEPFAVKRFSLAAPSPIPFRKEAVRTLADLSDRSHDKRPARKRRDTDFDRLRAQFPYSPPRDLRRCSVCILPETMPFANFDETGVCAYCRNFREVPLYGQEKLEELCKPHRRSDRPDCVVGISGGRDSLYGLHIIKTELGLNPVAYTYDWGMVTDLARRNISRICGKLGVEHILVSANIQQKRAFIRKNVEAWLAKPSLGMIPLFMAGDKAYFYHLRRIKKQLGVELAFLCENPLERTNFKAGFAGVSPVVVDDEARTLATKNKLQLARYYTGAILKNPRYWNASLGDSALAFAIYYLTGNTAYENLYNYWPWDEDTVSSTLINQYDFELAEDSATTWRIGDGTASFYNYIYHAVAGFTENDTFRSNQIRNGVMTRAEALERVERENKPRFPSMEWYLDTIGVERDIGEVLDIIERIPKLHGQA